MTEIFVIVAVGVGMLAQYIGYRQGHRDGAGHMYDMLYSQGKKEGNFIIIKLIHEPELNDGRNF
tara:strand:- start:15699 stop:15890 length:192 start_codon:yes stop_codon:yes gene_type:complete